MRSKWSFTTDLSNPATPLRPTLTPNQELVFDAINSGNVIGVESVDAAMQSIVSCGSIHGDFAGADLTFLERAKVDRCATAFVTDPAGFEVLDAAPFVMVGQGPWAPEFKQVLRETLQAGAGGPRDAGG